MGGLELLLQPIAVERFWSDHWHRGPLYIKGGPQKFAAFPGLEDLPSVLSGRLSPKGWVTGPVHSAQASFIDRAGNVRKVNAVSSMWPDLFNAGASLCFSAVDQCHEELTGLVQAVAAATKLPGRIVTTCYLTPPRSGSAMHFDSHHVFFIQVSGRKHWKIGHHPAWRDAPLNLQASSLGSQGVAAALKSAGIVVAVPEETDLRELTLNVGDVLYLPPGFWHEARTSDSHSLHYTLGFMPLGPWHLLAAYLRRGVLASSTLRRDVRFATECGDGDVAGLVDAGISELRKFVEQLSTSDVEKFFLEVASADGPFSDFFLRS